MIFRIRGKRGHGKDTIAKIIQQRVKQKGCKRFEQVGMADKLKIISNQMYQQLKPFFKSGCQYAVLNDEVKQVNMQFCRAWWTGLGRILKKHISQYVWLDAIFTKSFRHLYLNDSTKHIRILPDMRFKNQFDYFDIVWQQAVKQSGSYIPALAAAMKPYIYKIKVWRPGPHPVAGYLGTTQQKVNDISEVDLDDVPNGQYDCVIINDKGVETLKEKVVDFIDSVI